MPTKRDILIANEIECCMLARKSCPLERCLYKHDRNKFFTMVAVLNKLDRANNMQQTTNFSKTKHTNEKFPLRTG